MLLELSDEDARTLYDLLNAHLPGLRREVARTEDREYRHTMVQRQEICERLLASLRDSGFGVGPGTEYPQIATPTD